ncbi:MAG: hypothetical protein AAGG69_00550 [Pseudomonadota bacterium]
MPRYPELDWQDVDGEGSKAFTDDFALHSRKRVGGSSSGTYSAILNGSSLTSGGGPYGYDFDTLDAAKFALETAMRQAIDARIKYARSVLETYA